MGSIDSINKSGTDKEYEIIVVDNKGSKKYKKEINDKFPEVKYIKNSNKGYGAGNNLGAEHSKGEYLLFLNPDTLVKEGMVDKLVTFLEKHKKAGMVSPNFLHPDGSLFERSGSRELSPLSAIFSLSIISRLLPNNKLSRKYFASDISKKKTREMAAVPGSAFMIRKEVFQEVGGFDEHIFMYFEEHDLGRRVLQAGYKIYIYPKAEVVHKSEYTDRPKKLTKIFQKSRFYYFKKHYGIIKAALTELLLRLDKYDIVFIGVFVLAFILRFYKIWEFDSYFGEIGDNLLDIKNYYLNKEIPLAGPPTSHPWLDFGPMFYWIYGPILILSGFNPVSHAYFTSSISLLVVMFNYVFISRLTNKHIGLISSIFVAVSPFYISFGGRFFSLVLLLIYPYIYLFYNYLNKDKKYVFYSGLVMGAMLNFHLTPLLLVLPTLLLIYIYKKKKYRHDSMKYLSGIFIMNIPLLIKDITNNFEMISKFILWIPYRIAGFLGLYPKNTLDSAGFQENLSSFNWFVTNSVINKNPFLAVVVLVVFLIAVYKLILSIYNNGRKKQFWVMTLAFFLFGYIGIFIHGNPPSHYYMPIAFVPSVVISYLLYQYRDKFGLLITLFMFIVIANNILNYFSESYFYKDRAVVSDTGSVPYELKLDAAEAIVEDTVEEPYKLNRVGNLDDFEGDFAQDYQYLLWWMGNEPVRVGEDVKVKQEEPKKTYTIWERDMFTKDEEVVFEKGGLVITKDSENND